MDERTLHEHVEEFGSRLARIGAAAATLRRLSTPAALIDHLERIDRDLLLAAHDLDVLREHASREQRSLSGAPARDA